MRRPGFTLIELLVVVAIIAVLIAILLPGLSVAQRQAKLVKAHAELRSITLALDFYQEEHRGELPVTRFSCNTRSEYELPVELGQAGYLPLVSRPVVGGIGFVEAVDMPDVFDPDGDTYRYRAPGSAIMNEFTLWEHAASLWVPDNFEASREPVGQYYFSQRDVPEKRLKASPIRYALWSIGPDPASPKWNTPGYQSGWKPVPRVFWCEGAFDTGVITHFQDRAGRIHQSP